MVLLISQASVYVINLCERREGCQGLVIYLLLTNLLQVLLTDLPSSFLGQNDVVVFPVTHIHLHLSVH